MRGSRALAATIRRLAAAGEDPGRGAHRWRADIPAAQVLLQALRAHGPTLSSHRRAAGHEQQERGGGGGGRLTAAGGHLPVCLPCGGGGGGGPASGGVRAALGRRGLRVGGGQQRPQRGAKGAGGQPGGCGSQGHRGGVAAGCGGELGLGWGFGACVQARRPVRACRPVRAAPALATCREASHPRPRSPRRACRRWRVPPRPLASTTPPFWRRWPRRRCAPCRSSPPLTFAAWWSRSQVRAWGRQRQAGRPGLGGGGRARHATLASINQSPIPNRPRLLLNRVQGRHRRCGAGQVRGHCL